VNNPVAPDVRRRDVELRLEELVLVRRPVVVRAVVRGERVEYREDPQRPLLGAR